jgi:hypothetical protein
MPRLSALRIDLDGAAVREGITPQRPPKPEGTRTPGPSVAALDVTGRPVQFQGSRADVHVTGRELTFDFARGAGGDPLLVLTDAADGRVEVKIGKGDLRAILTAAATAAARSQGVAIQSLDVDLNATGPRSLAVAVRVKAKKSIMSGVVHVRGRVDVDDQIVATVSGLACTGEGMVGTMAAGMAQGKLRALEGRTFELAAFSLGDVALRDVAIGTADGIEVTAAFGRRG